MLLSYSDKFSKERLVVKMEKGTSEKKINVKDMILIAMFAAITAVLSQIAIPMPSGVPVTLQTFAVALCGYVCGSKKGAAALAVYTLLGAVGVPVFANFKGGLGALAGPTGGFIWGFIIMAFLCGIGIEMKKKWLAVLLGAAGLIACHICGTAQFAVIKGGGFFSSALLVSVPYLLKDIISVAVALAAAEVIRHRVKIGAAVTE